MLVIPKDRVRKTTPENMPTTKNQNGMQEIFVNTCSQLSSSRRQFRSALTLTCAEVANCQICMKEGDMKSSVHHLLNCPAFARLRLKHFSRHTLANLAKLLELILAALTKVK